MSTIQNKQSIFRPVSSSAQFTLVVMTDACFNNPKYAGSSRRFTPEKEKANVFIGCVAKTSQLVFNVSADVPKFRINNP